MAVPILFVPAQSTHDLTDSASQSMSPHPLLLCQKNPSCLCHRPGKLIMLVLTCLYSKAVANFLCSLSSKLIISHKVNTLGFSLSLCLHKFLLMCFVFFIDFFFHLFKLVIEKLLEFLLHISAQLVMVSVFFHVVRTLNFYYACILEHSVIRRDLDTLCCGTTHFIIY